MEESLKSYWRNHLPISSADPAAYSPLSLAYIGDAVFDVIVRTIVVSDGNMPVSRYHKRTTEYVKAETQAKLMYAIEPELTEEERAVYKRGRNAKSASVARHASVIDYRIATGFEALLGYLYLRDRDERIADLLSIAFRNAPVEEGEREWKTEH